MHAKLFGGRVVNLEVGEHMQTSVHLETPGQDCHSEESRQKRDDEESPEYWLSQRFRFPPWAGLKMTTQSFRISTHEEKLHFSLDYLLVF